MGATQSSLSVLTREILDEYVMLSYLNKVEIFKLYNKFGSLDQCGHLQNLNFRFPVECIENIFPHLKYNPFKDRIFRVFSSQKDNKLSFEDLLDLASVMSERCPDRVKAIWAFRIFDFDEDEALGEEDLVIVIDRLTQYAGTLSDDNKKTVIKTLLEELDMEGSGSIGQMEFEHAVGKMSEFSHAFCFRL